MDFISIIVVRYTVKMITRNKAFAFILSIILPISVPVFAQDLEEDYTNVAAMALPERSMPLVNYQQDWQQFTQVVSDSQVSSLTALRDDEAKRTKSQNQETINTIQEVNKAVSKIAFKTPEGKQVKKDFIAFNDASIDAVLRESEWENNENLAVEVTQKLETLNAQLVQSMMDLKLLAEE